MDETNQNQNDFNPQNGVNLASVNNHLLLGILTTLFCCLPFGVISIVYAVQVNTAVASGNTQVALMASEKAKFWGILALVIGIVIQLLSAVSLFLCSAIPALALASQY